MPIELESGNLQLTDEEIALYLPAAALVPYQVTCLNERHSDLRAAAGFGLAFGGNFYYHMTWR